MKHKGFEKKLFIFLSILLVVITILSFRHYYLLQLKKPSIKKLPKLPKVAIVIDDWGYNLNNIDLLHSIDTSLTLAILPNLKYSREITEEAKFKNREIILHMPMEPKRFVRLEKQTLATNMGENEIDSIFYNDLNNTHGIRGVSNHMGSKFTADRGAMTIFLKQLKKKNLYFLDNVSCDNSVCKTVANNLKVKFAQRDVYLDNFNDTNYIKGQFNQLIEIAKKRGYAVGTGHDRKKTLEVIKGLASALKDKIKFVLVSELTK